MIQIKKVTWWLMLGGIVICISIVIFLSGGMMARVSTGQIAGQTVDSPLPSPSVTVFEPTGTPPGPDFWATEGARFLTEVAPGPPVLDPNYPTGTPLPPPVYMPEPTAFSLPEGTPAGVGFIVFDMPSFKIVPSMEQWQNTWVKNFDRNRQQLAVWAGAEGRADLKLSSQGLIAMMTFEIVTEPVYKGFTFSSGLDQYRTPTQSGAVRIVDAVGETLILQSAGGEIYYFDLPSRQFVPAIPGGTPTPLPPVDVVGTAVSPTAPSDIATVVAPP
ncbi:MAG: hypothetical protein R2932_31975 [Caldilineaceae bacterium]